MPGTAHGNISISLKAASDKPPIVCPLREAHVIRCPMRRSWVALGAVVLPVGLALSRRKLADELKISVPPVMEALQRLEHEGLVESKPRVGTRVRVPTRQDAEDRSLVREALESQAARLFAERATPEEKVELRQMGRRVDQLYAACEKSAGDRDFLFSVNTYHMKLHLRIAECARCPALRDAIEKEQVLIFNWLYETAVDRRSLASDYHARLTDMIARGSPAQDL